MATFPERIRQIRESLGLSQNEFSKRLSISRVSLTHYEAGDRTPDIEFLKRLHYETGYSLYYLLGLTDSKDDAFATTQRDTGLSEDSLALFESNQMCTEFVNRMVGAGVFVRICETASTIYNDSILHRSISKENWSPRMELSRQSWIDSETSWIKERILSASLNASTPIDGVKENKLPSNRVLRMLDDFIQNRNSLELLAKSGDQAAKKQLQRQQKAIDNLLISEECAPHFLTFKVTDTFCEFPEVVSDNGEETPEQ